MPIAFAHSYGVPNSDSYIHTYSDCHGHIHAYADCYIYAYRNGNSYGYSYSHGDCIAAAYTYATAATDTAASSLALFRSGGTRENELASSQPEVDRPAAAGR